jgi:pentatricopeptide repeat protein
LIEANPIALWSLVTACKKLGALHQGKWLHGYLIKCVFELGSYLVTTLLDVYAKCGIIRDARSVFDELCDIDLISWTAMIFGRTQKGCSEEALKLFMHKECAGVLPNDVTVASVFQHVQSVHGLSIKSLGHGSLLSQTLWWILMLNAKLIDMLVLYLRQFQIGIGCLEFHYFRALSEWFCIQSP